VASLDSDPGQGAGCGLVGRNRDLGGKDTPCLEMPPQAPLATIGSPKGKGREESEGGSSWAQLPDPQLSVGPDPEAASPAG
jgi:hypothetical protein